MNQQQIDAIRARLAKLKGGTTISSGESIAMIRALLDQHDADQQRIAALEAALRDHGPIVYPLYEIGDTAHSAFIVSGDPQVKQFMQKISRHTDVALSRIRAALKGDDND